MTKLEETRELLEKADKVKPLAEFDGKKTVKIKGENDTTLIPFHAVKKVESGIASADATKSDAYCAEE